ncbi:MAG: hypothetical protein JW827_10475 [Spirochaetes bacterium]|nr:hypothetical protein [Spirochaetota bacterium]
MTGKLSMLGVCKREKKKMGKVSFMGKLIFVEHGLNNRLNCFIMIMIFFLLLSPCILFSAESFTSGPTNTPDPFNWGPGAVPSATVINLQTTKATDLRIEIYDKPPNTTTLVRRFYSDVLSGTTLSTTWQGTRDSGLELTNGTYTGKFKLKLELDHQLTIQGNGIIFDYPSDVALDSSGNIYIINKENRSVQKFNPGGILLLFDFKVTCVSNNPEGIAVDSSGNIYVANTYYGRVEKYNSSGTLVSSNWASNLNQPTGMCSDSSNIYIADEGDDVIYKVRIDTGGAVSVAASPGGGNDYFYDPKDVDMDSNGYFYIVGRGRWDRFYLFRHNPNGTYNNRTQLEWGVLDPGFIAGVSVDAQDNIYVVCSGDSGQIPIRDPFIEQYNTALAQQGATFGSYGSGDNEFADPLGIGAYYNPSDNKTYVYVADAGNSRIQKIAETNNTWNYEDSIAEDENNVISPNDVAVDSSGNVYVVCETINKVKVFNSSGIYQYSISEYGLDDGQVNAPKGITVDSTGRVYISDRGRWDLRGSVQVFTNTVFESRLFGPGNNYYLNGMGVDMNDNVYTCWENNGNVYRNAGGWIDVGSSAEDVCIDYKTNAYVSSAVDGTIDCYNYSGVLQGNVNTAGTPHVGIVVDQFGDIFCATSAGIERYNNNLSSLLGIYLSSEIDNAQGLAFSPDHQYLWVADKDNSCLKKYKLVWDEVNQDSMTIQDTNQAPTVNNVILSGTNVEDVDSEYYARKGRVTFIVDFSENMNTSSNVSVKYVVNGSEYYITETSFVGNTWIGTCTVASNDGEATISIRDGYDAGGTLQDPNPNIEFTFFIDTSPPAAPTVDQPGSPTSESVIQVKGSAEQNIFVHVYNSSQATGGTNISYQSNVQVDGDGDWTANAIALLTDTPPKTNFIWAVAVDKAGNVSSASYPRKIVVYVDPSAGSGYITPSSNVYLNKTYGKPWSIFYTVNSYMSNGTMTVQIPHGWAYPSTNSTDDGYVYIKNVTLMTLETTDALTCSNHFIKVSFKNAVPGAQVEISYGNTGSICVSNYATIGINSFAMRAENNDPDHDWYPDDTIVPQSADKTLDITVLGEDLKIGYSGSMPVIVYRGQSSITAMTLFMQNDNGGTNHDEVTVLKITTENSNNTGINANTAISRILVTDGSTTYKNLTTIPASSVVNIDMTSTPIPVNASSIKTVWLIIDISTTASASSIQLNLNTDTDVVARDKSSQTSIDVTTNIGYDFPMRTSHAVIQTNLQAKEVNIGLINSMPTYVERNQTNVIAARLFFFSTNASVNDIKITELNLIVEDKSGSGIVPNSVISKVVIQKGPTVYLSDTTIESSGTNIFLDLASSPVFVPNLSSVTVNVKVTISPTVYATNFQLNLRTTNSITAKDMILNTYVAIKNSPGYSFPMRTGNALIATKFVILHDGSANQSQWERVIVKVCNTNGSTITNYTETVTLDTTGDVNNIAWTNNYSFNGVFTDGGAGTDRATYTFASADAGVITLSVRDDTVETIDILASSRFITGRSNDLKIISGGPPVITFSKTSYVTNTTSYIQLGGAASDFVPGAKVTYTIYYTNEGSGTALNLMISDIIPPNQVYNSNSMVLNGLSVSDADDSDPADYNVSTPGGVTAIVTNVGPSDAGTLKFEVYLK